MPKTSKNTCVKESKYLYLYFQCNGNSHSFVQINLSDCYNGVSVKLKYLSSYDHEVINTLWYDYIFNPVLFIISLEGSHFGYRVSMLVSHQNSQTIKEIGVDISVFYAPIFLYWHKVEQWFNCWQLLQLQSSTMIDPPFWGLLEILIVNY